MIVIEFERTGTAQLDTTVRVIDTEQSQPLAERTFPPGKFSPLGILTELYSEDKCVRIELGREGS